MTRTGSTTSMPLHKLRAISYRSHLKEFESVYPRHFLQPRELRPNWISHRKQSIAGPRDSCRSCGKGCEGFYVSSKHPLISRLRQSSLCQGTLFTFQFSSRATASSCFLFRLPHKVPFGLLTCMNTPDLLGFIITIFSKVPGSNGHYDTIFNEL